MTSVDKVSAVEKTSDEITDQAVLDYLKRKGLSSAVLELTNALKSGEQETKEKSTREQLEEDDAIMRSQRSLVTKVSHKAL